MLQKKDSLINSSSKLSRNVLIALLLWFTIVPMTKNWQNPLSWDVFGYYLYIPATVIWHDAALKDFSKVEATNNKYENTGTFYQGGKTDQGNWMIKYTMGLALLESPFFVAAHIIAPMLGYPADGFSKPYQSAMIIAHFFYLLIGFIFLRKMLLKLFSDKVTALLLLLLVLGTNYYAMGMLVRGITPIHALEFSLISIFLFLTICWHETPKRKTAVLLGLVYGLIVLVRPSDILIIIIPLLWGITSLKTITEKALFVFKEHKTDMLVFLITLLIVLFPQMYYWKTVADKWLLFSYSNNPGEGFEFKSPYIFQVLFSFRKGWLTYTPLMLFALAGFWFLYKQKKELFLPLVLFFLLNIYLVSSWSCWWYAGCFGQRALVDSYATLLIPFGCFLNEMFLFKKAALKYLFAGLMLLFVLLNIFQTWQYEHRIIDGSRMTKAFYFKTFGKTSVTEEDKKLLLVDRGDPVFSNENEYTSRTLFSEDFNSPSEEQKTQYSDSLAKEGKYCLRLNSGFVFTPKHEMSFAEITKKDHAWIRCTGWFYPNKEMEGNPLSLVITFVNFEGKLYDYYAVDISKQLKEPFKLNSWNKFTIDHITPEVRNIHDKINIYFWYKEKAPVYVDDLQIQAFEKNN